MDPEVDEAMPYDEMVETTSGSAFRYYDILDIPSQICNTVGANQIAGLWISILGVYFPPKRYRIVPDLSTGTEPERKIGLRVMDLKDSWPQTVFVLDINFPGNEEKCETKGGQSGARLPAPLNAPVMKPADKFLELVRSICTGERLYAAVINVHEVKFTEFVSKERCFRSRSRESWQNITGILEMRDLEESGTYNVSFDKQSVHYILKGIAKDVN